MFLINNLNKIFIKLVFNKLLEVNIHKRQWKWLFPSQENTFGDLFQNFAN